MIIPAILVGAALLLFGRQLFWLFVGGIGFVAGMTLATEVIQGQPDWVVLLVAIAAGLAGAVLSIFLQRFAIGMAGFFAGGYALVHLATKSGHSDWTLAAFIVGALLGALLVLLLFDWALIILSSLTGATVIVDSLHLGSTAELTLFAGLFLAGLLTQGARFRHRVPREAQPASR